MTRALADRQANLFDDVEQFCDKVLNESSIYTSCTVVVTACSPIGILRPVRQPGQALGTAVGGGDGHGAPAPRRALGPRGRRSLLLRQPLALCSRRRWLRHRWLDELFPHRARRHPRTPATIRAPRPHLRHGTGAAKAEASSATDGRSTRRRSMTPWRRWTPSPLSALASGPS